MEGKILFKPAKKNSKENYGLKTTKSPETIPELKNFENDLISMIQNIEFKKFSNPLQQNLKPLCND